MAVRCALRSVAVGTWSRRVPLLRSFTVGTRLAKCLHYSSFTTPRPPFDVLFLGSDEVSLPTLKALAMAREHASPLVGDLQVVCPREKTANKSLTGVVKSWAIQNGLPIHQPLSLKDWAVPTTRAGSKLHIAIVASFGLFIPSAIVDHFQGHTLNMHPSMLPKYRGAAPIYYTLLNGDTDTGITILRIHPTQFDAGDILLQVPHTISPTSPFLQVRNELAEKGATAIIQTLKEYSMRSSSAKPQPNIGVSHAPKIKRSQTQLNWTEETPQQLLQRYRAFADTFGVFTHLWDGRIVKIEGMAAVETSAAEGALLQLPPGRITFKRAQNRLLVTCRNGLVAITRLKTEGRNSTDAIGFANGYLQGKDDVVYSFK